MYSLSSKNVRGRYKNGPLDKRKNFFNHEAFIYKFSSDLTLNIALLSARTKKTSTDAVHIIPLFLKALLHAVSEPRNKSRKNSCLTVHKIIFFKTETICLGEVIIPSKSSFFALVLVGVNVERRHEHMLRIFLSELF